MGPRGKRIGKMAHRKRISTSGGEEFMKTETDGMKHPMMQLAGDIANAWEVDLAQANAEMSQSNYSPEVTRNANATIFAIDAF
jgi:hypothetical protein